MADPIDYLAAAVVREMKQGSGPEISSIQAIKDVFGLEYDLNISDKDAKYVAAHLHKLGFVRLISDRYAGDIIEPAGSGIIPFRLDKLKKGGEGVGFLYAYGSTDRLFEAAFKNPQFWSDLESINNDPEEYEAVEHDEVDVPASDRIVTLSHNSVEGKLVASVIEDVVADLNTNNAVADEAGAERERLISEGRASLELLKGERIRKSAFIEVVWKFLKEVASKFREKSAEWSVEKALEVMNKMLDLLN